MIKSKKLVKGVLILALSVLPIALPFTARAQDDDKTVKQDVKDAGHSTKEAGEKTGKETKKTTKKVVHKSAKKVGEASDKVQDKTRDNSNDNNISK